VNAGGASHQVYSLKYEDINVEEQDTAHLHRYTCVSTALVYWLFNLEGEHFEIGFSARRGLQFMGANAKPARVYASAG
jgi:hypothetical protein